MTDTPRPIYVRLFQVQDTFGVSESTVRRWGKRGLLTIHTRPGMSFVRFDDMARIIEGDGG